MAGTMCIICHENGRDQTQYPPGNNQLELRKHLVAQHFSTHRPFRCPHCDFRFGDTSFLMLDASVRVCCDQYNKEHVDILWEPRPMTQKLLDMFVAHSEILQQQGNTHQLTLTITQVLNDIKEAHPLPTGPSDEEAELIDLQFSAEDQQILDENVIGVPPVPLVFATNPPEPTAALPVPMPNDVLDSGPVMTSSTVTITNNSDLSGERPLSTTSAASYGSQRTLPLGASSTPGPGVVNTSQDSSIGNAALLHASAHCLLCDWPVSPSGEEPTETEIDEFKDHVIDHLRELANDRRTQQWIGHLGLPGEDELQEDSSGLQLWTGKPEPKGARPCKSYQCPIPRCKMNFTKWLDRLDHDTKVHNKPEAFSQCKCARCVKKGKTTTFVFESKMATHLTPNNKQALKVEENIVSLYPGDKKDLRKLFEGYFTDREPIPYYMAVFYWALIDEDKQVLGEVWDEIYGHE